MTGRRRDPNRDAGQAAVELALSLPLVVALLVAVVQAGLVVRDQVLVVHAAREAARAAAVAGTAGTTSTGASTGATAARRAALAGSGLDPDRLEVRVTTEGARIRANVRYRSRVVAPVLSGVVRDVVLVGNVAMTSEKN
ncbi:MAG TPA: TadE/TadG family type IV pilus assembly protein [Acidimicrobiales bacterium]|nr:TadE/TadG family type IV pilus assembly protein [Acidimicrobiales bacterium]